MSSDRVLTIPDEAVRRAGHWMKARQGRLASMDYWRSEMAGLLQHVGSQVVAAELERLAQEIHDRGAFSPWTALDIEFFLKGRAAELRGGQSDG